MSGLYHQILLSLQKVLSDPVRPLCSHYGAVVGLHGLGWKVSLTSLLCHPCTLCSLYIHVMYQMSSTLFYLLCV